MQRSLGFYRSALLVAFACGAALPASANLVNNGKFAGASGSFTTVYAPSNSITGWTVTSASIDWIGSYWQAPPVGGNSLDMDGLSPGSISQTVTTVAGVTYDLSFYLSGNPDGQGQTYPGASAPNPPTKLLNVSASGAPTQLFSYTVLYGVNSEANMLWAQQSYIFTATSGSTTISFASADPSGNPWGAAVGGVNLQATPEPGFYGILGLGISGLLFVIGRRRKANLTQGA